METATLVLLLSALATASQNFRVDSLDQSEFGFAAQLRDEPIRVFQPGGKTVELLCRAGGSENNRRSPRITWHYKKCGEGLQLPSCSEFSYEPDLSTWLGVVCGGLPCTNRTLALPEPSESDNGLYRCSANRRPITTYELAVVDPLTIVAQIRNISTNETAWVGQPARLQCRVESRVTPRVMWLRQQSGAPIVFLNNSYQQMLAHLTVAFRGDIYISKLEFPRAQLSDAGLYVCVAMTNEDFTFKLARLTVRPKYFQTDVADSESGSLHWLFLVPLALALVPAFAWLGCAWRRRQKLRADKYAPVVA